MPLNLYPSVLASGCVPQGWKPVRRSPLKYPVKNAAVLRALEQLQPGRWQKVIKVGTDGSEVHYFEHGSGAVAGVKYFSPEH